jgi:hypothetical protein
MMSLLSASIYLVVTIIIVALIAWQIYTPTVIVPIINKYFKTSDYDCIGGTIYSDYTIYEKEGAVGCLLWLPGGSFLTALRRPIYGLLNEFYARENFPYDQIVYEYPCRFAYTLQETLKSITTRCKILLSKYNSIHIVGISAGGLLSGIFTKKETDSSIAKYLDVESLNLPIQSLSLLSPCSSLDQFSSKFLNSLAKFYLGRNTKNFQYYNCDGIKIPVYLVTSQSDPLHTSALKIITSNLSYKYKLYDDDGISGHAFMQNISFPRTQEVIEQVASFIIENTSS